MNDTLPNNASAMALLLQRLRSNRDAVSVVRKLKETGQPTVEAAMAAGFHMLDPLARPSNAAFVHEHDLETAAAELARYDARRARLRADRQFFVAHGAHVDQLTHTELRLGYRIGVPLHLGDATLSVGVPALRTLPADVLELDKEALGAALDAARAEGPEADALARALKSVRVALDAAQAAFPDLWDDEALAESVRLRLASPFASPAEAEKYLTKQIRRRRHTVEAAARSQTLDAHVNLGRYEEAFPLARSMGRRLVALLGPTNSGKTHAAMEALAQARSGAYLAPLRLLALEGQEALLSRGVETSLLTGEERDWRQGARHVASTVELADFERPVDVAVIDEIQMLADPDRGWAWTAALVGAPARILYLVGAPEAEDALRRLAAYLGEELEVHRFERKVPLTPLDRPSRLADVEPGDALIAFSRRGVIELKNLLAERGVTAAVVYGALGPEVRRREAERFRTGEAAVLVATDAIGMGLNLPIRRILFSAVDKYDGSRERPLTPGEARQIAGRAGRFGLAEAGFYGTLGRRGDHARLLTILERSPSKVADRVGIMPTRRHLNQAAAALGTDKMQAVLAAFAGYVLPKTGTPFAMADLANALALARWLDTLPLGFKDKTTLVFCPVDAEDPGQFGLYQRWTRALAKGQRVAPPSRAWGRGDDLQRQEGFVRECVLYLWFARAFPDLCDQEESARARRDAANAEIIRLLALRRISRSCGRCGEELPSDHRFAICDPCFHGKAAWDADDGAVYVAR